MAQLRMLVANRFSYSRADESKDSELWEENVRQVKVENGKLKMYGVGLVY